MDRQSVILSFLAVENTGKLLIKGAPGNTVYVIYGGVRGKARPDRRNCLIFRPINELRQRRPVGLVH
jgi:hypothetical protein